MFLWLNCYFQIQIFPLPCPSFIDISAKSKLIYLVSLETLGSPVEFEIVTGLYKFVNMHPLVTPTSQQPKLKMKLAKQTIRANECSETRVEHDDTGHKA